MSKIIKMDVSLLENVELYENIGFTAMDGDFEDVHLKKLTGVDVVEFALQSESDIHRKLQSKLSAYNDIELLDLPIWIASELDSVFVETSPHVIDFDLLKEFNWCLYYDKNNRSVMIIDPYSEHEAVFKLLLGVYYSLIDEQYYDFNLASMMQNVNYNKRIQHYGVINNLFEKLMKLEQKYPVGREFNLRV